MQLDIKHELPCFCVNNWIKIKYLPFTFCFYWSLTIKIDKLLLEIPGAELIAHPECEADLLDKASYIGSTAGLLKYTQTSKNNTFIVATESGILHQMQKSSPNKTFIPAPPNNSCACNDCPYMKLNTLEKVYNCLKYELPAIELPADLIEQAKKPIIKMLEISAKLGL